MTSLYAGIDLHSNNSHLAILDQDDKRVFHKKLPNMEDVLLAELKPFQDELSAVVVESTFNWYWLVDCLMEQRYEVLLANPAAMLQYKGLKHVDDKHDAFWLAHMARLGILPQGYIYPKEERPFRDLLRKRGHLVRLRTSVINSLQGIISRNCGCSLSGNKMKRMRENHVAPLLTANEDLAFSGEVSREVIDFLGQQISRIEPLVLEKVQLRKPFQCLQSIPGVGKILSLTIMLETGPITRFKKVGNFTSYCRKVPTTWTSNSKKKGKGNSKNGNKYLAWTFSEAAEYSRRHSDQARAFFNRKAARTNKSVAYSALAHKLARASYYMMRDQVCFNPNKLFT
ncbi:transposase [Desulfocapsa sulfexigens DSM 10523]|uniref:Transposase n=1 Tax=Desulfocapsa sulfexigens (strain DSM 10523 / SB164P1) TaxID=1167006 RepID=M1P3I6_DESSD|nr:IS110 family transposase [Desulfocapsa sulfexigens]AGF78018.1 transposase [Desulfocapsa sulfexigens DSM 10523]